MKKILILAIVILLSINGFAQRSAHKYAQPVSCIQDNTIPISYSNPYAKTTAVGDTLKISHIAVGDTLVIYSAGADSGYLTGTDYWNDQAFAERYEFNGADSSVKVIGVFAQFGGKVSASSSKTVSFNVWGINSPQYIANRLFYSGLPGALWHSESVSATQLGIGTSVDTLKKFMFDSTTGFLSGSFFVGYGISYNFNTLNGDTLGLASSKDGKRTSPKITYRVTITDIDTVVDTMINVQNATQWSDGAWHDNYSDNDSISNDLAIFPIVIIGAPTGVKGVTRNNLTFYGSYPNPAVNSTKIKFSLARHTDVNIQVMDMTGRILSTITEPNLAPGEYNQPINTTALPAGDYLYLIRTSEGDGMAGKMTIVK